VADDGIQKRRTPCKDLEIDNLDDAVKALQSLQSGDLSR
jgi:hypothetical protein